MTPTIPNLRQVDLIILHPGGSPDPEKVSLAIGVLEWIRLSLVSAGMNATLWPETAFDATGRHRFILRAAPWVASDVRRKLQLLPTAEGVLYLNIEETPEPLASPRSDDPEQLLLEPKEPLAAPPVPLYHPDYRTDFPSGDDPYRYYRW